LIAFFAIRSAISCSGVVSLTLTTLWCITALAGRLVSAVHPPAELMPAARALAREIADNAAPVSVALTRQMMWRMLGAAHPMEAHRIDSRLIFQRGKSADAKEGVTSFLEKRQAHFPDKVSRDMPAMRVRERPQVMLAQ